MRSAYWQHVPFDTSIEPWKGPGAQRVVEVPWGVGTAIDGPAFFEMVTPNYSRIRLTEPGDYLVNFEASLSVGFDGFTDPPNVSAAGALIGTFTTDAGGEVLVRLAGDERPGAAMDNLAGHFEVTAPIRVDETRFAGMFAAPLEIAAVVYCLVFPVPANTVVMPTQLNFDWPLEPLRLRIVKLEDGSAPPPPPAGSVSAGAAAGAIVRRG